MYHFDTTHSIFFDEFGNPYTPDDEVDDNEDEDAAEDRFTRFMDH